MTTSRPQANIPKLELKLNLSPTRSGTYRLNEAELSSPGSSEGSSCTSFGPEDGMRMMVMNSEGGQEAASASMVLVGCPRCLMYVMLSAVNPKCPQCKSTVLLDLANGRLHGGNAAKKGQ